MGLKARGLDYEQGTHISKIPVPREKYMDKQISWSIGRDLKPHTAVAALPPEKKPKSQFLNFGATFERGSHSLAGDSWHHEPG